MCQVRNQRTSSACCSCSVWLVCSKAKRNWHKTSSYSSMTSCNPLACSDLQSAQKGAAACSLSPSHAPSRLPAARQRPPPGVPVPRTLPVGASGKSSSQAQAQCYPKSKRHAGVWGVASESEARGLKEVSLEAARQASSGSPRTGQAALNRGRDLDLASGSCKAAKAARRLGPANLADRTRLILAFSPLSSASSARCSASEGVGIGFGLCFCLTSSARAQLDCRLAHWRLGTLLVSALSRMSRLSASTGRSSSLGAGVSRRLR